jgi:hypothetical protein
MGPSMSNPVADYLHELYLIAGVSVPETSGYPALSKLLNNVGESLKPKITAVIHPSDMHEAFDAIRPRDQPGK